MMKNFHNPDIETICSFLHHCKTLAIVGLSPKTDRPSHRVAAAMQGFGFRIIPVRPAVSEILGEKVWPSLTDLDQAVDLAVIFRNPSLVQPIVDACIEKSIPVWMQDGVVNEAAATTAVEAGLFTVMNRCVYRDYSSSC